MPLLKRHIALLLIPYLLACTAVRLQSYGGCVYTLTDSLQADDSANIIVHPYKSVLDTLMSEILNISDVEMTGKQPEGLIGNFVADLCMSEAKKYYNPEDKHGVDFCILNNGGLRASLPKGNITLRHIYELMPFENELLILTISGDQCKKLFKYIGYIGGLPQSGLRITLKGKEPEEVMVGNKIFDPSKNYKVLTTDYLANKGGNWSFFSHAIKVEKPGIKLRDAIIEYIREEQKKGKHIISAYDGRIKYVH